MASSIFTAPPYDPRRERRRKLMVAAFILAAIVIGILAYQYRNWPEERVTNRFLTALENKDYKRAYGIWMADPGWEQHPQQHSRYSFNDFYQDWGPGGEWGPIRNFRIDGSANPKGATGVVVQVTINQRKEPARIWVEKRDKSLGFSPY